MGKRIFTVMILSGLLAAPATQAGLLDQLKARAQGAIQGSMEDVTGAVDAKVNEATAPPMASRRSCTAPPPTSAVPTVPTLSASAWA